MNADDADSNLRHPRSSAANSLPEFGERCDSFLKLSSQKIDFFRRIIRRPESILDLIVVQTLQQVAQPACVGDSESLEQLLVLAAVVEFDLVAVHLLD